MFNNFPNLTPTNWQQGVDLQKNTKSIFSWDTSKLNKKNTLFETHHRCLKSHDTFPHLK